MKLTGIIATCTTAAVLATAGVSVAGAASDSGTTARTATTAGVAHPKAARATVRGGIAVAAKTIGIKPADLAKELRAGASIAEVATAHGKTPQSVIDALVAAGTTRINQARDNGKISAEQAGKALAKLSDRATKAVNAKRDAKGPREKRKHARRAAHLGRGAVVAAAKAIGVQPADLTKELRSGKTIAQIATDHGKTAQDAIDAIVAAGTARINKAKDAGKLSEERAAKALEKLPERAAKFVNEWTPKHK